MISRVSGIVVISCFDLTNLYRLWAKREENEDGGAQISKGGIQVSGTKDPWIVTQSRLSHPQFFFAKRKNFVPKTRIPDVVETF